MVGWRFLRQIFLPPMTPPIIAAVWEAGCLVEVLAATVDPTAIVDVIYSHNMFSSDKC
jgi:hypothetical protein